MRLAFRHSREYTDLPRYIKYILQARRYRDCYIRVSFSACACVHGRGLVNIGNLCSVNSSVQVLRHWPLLWQLVCKAQIERDEDVVRRDAARWVLPRKGTDGRWFCVVLMSWCDWFRKSQAQISPTGSDPGNAAEDGRKPSGVGQ